LHDLALAKSMADRAIAGAADNGTFRYDGSLDWHRFGGGDGGAAAIDPVDANRFYFSGNEGDVQQYLNGSVPPQLFLGPPPPFPGATPPPGGIPSSEFQNCHAYDQTFELLVHPMNSTPVLDPCGSLWRTADLTAPGYWSEILKEEDLPDNDRVVRAAIDASDPNIDLYYAGTVKGRLRAGFGGANWQQIFAHPDSLKLSDIQVDSAHPDTIYVSFAPYPNVNQGCDELPSTLKIYQLKFSKSSNPPSVSLAMKTNITENLPSGRCVNALALDPHIPRTLYAATDRGVYRGRSNAVGGLWVWESYNKGMPPIDVRDLKVDIVAGQIYASTFGRSAFRVTTETILPVNIDIKPGTSENIVNIKSQGKIPVAILSSLTFYAPAEVDRTSLTFGRTGNEASFVLCNGDGEDVNGDGLLDLVCHFATQLTGTQLGDTEGILKGKTLEGVPIEGSDSLGILIKP